MKTILSTIKDFLSKSENVNEFVPFNIIFDYVEKELSPMWIKEDNNLHDFEEIIYQKRGETYKLMTVDGSFERNENGDWKLKGN